MEVLYDADACEQIRNMVIKCGDVYYQEFCDKYPDTPCICTSSWYNRLYKKNSLE